jgi:hypothetical protein
VSAQRWRDRHDSYRPPRETIRTSLYDVEEIPEDSVAREFVERHHYSGTYPAARFRAGLFRRGELVGVFVASHPCNNRVLTNVFPALRPTDAVELGRFVLLDEVPANGETWFLARAFELLRRLGIRGVVSFSDPVPRTDIHGRRIFPGHIGTIYQAHNARFLGRATSGTLKLLPDGTVYSRRAMQKVRSGSKGWRYAAGQLEAWGADPLSEGCSARERKFWLRRWLQEITRDIRHPGNLRYGWPLDRGVSLPAGEQYPKAVAA